MQYSRQLNTFMQTEILFDIWTVVEGTKSCQVK